MRDGRIIETYTVLTVNGRALLTGSEDAFALELRMGVRSGEVITGADQVGGVVGVILDPESRGLQIRTLERSDVSNGWPARNRLRRRQDITNRFEVLQVIRVMKMGFSLDPEEKRREQREGGGKRPHGGRSGDDIKE
jgi:hypothetical protein